MKLGARWLLTLAMVAVGVLHFVNPEPFVRIVPAFLPVPLGLVYLSGACEIAGGLGLAWRRSRRLAAWGLVALYVAVFPANVNMAVNDLPLGDSHVAPAALWARLPLQIVLVFWAYWFTRREPAAGDDTSPPAA